MMNQTRSSFREYRGDRKEKIVGPMFLVNVKTYGDLLHT